jgi:hypothetical protein
MIILVIGLDILVLGGLAYHYFNKKLMLSIPPAAIPLNESIEADMKLMKEKINTLENLIGMIRR